ncbi:hypothetical protein [Nocardia sp. NPDC005998]|uniref:DUF6968 family protein n=1 Tax=Nocardia sp. NPDC005998 TaxID=3156894 RepID=UPI0033AF9FDE
MAMTWELGEPIATRELRKGDDPVVVTFGKPKPSEGGSYSCPVRIEGMEAEPLTRAIFGVDAVQAIIEAMTFAGRLLEASEGEYTFLGESDLGFPRS